LHTMLNRLLVTLLITENPLVPTVDDSCIPQLSGKLLLSQQRRFCS
jgi:hypothetical protein